MRKKILFVINTLGHAGAEVAMIELIKSLDAAEYDIHLYVMLGQGELISRIPEHVKLLNRKYNDISVLSGGGKRNMVKTVLSSSLRRGNIIKRIPYLAVNTVLMIKNRNIMPEKLMWRLVADGAQRFDEEYDLAIAYLEGASSYYAADYVKAKKKAAFIHVDYVKAGYNKKLDLNTYLVYDKIFTVSGEVAESFTALYPEYAYKTSVFHNMLDLEYIKNMSKEAGGFDDGYTGVRLLTVGRLTKQKAYEVAIDAMALLKKEYADVRWYVLGEGPQREFLEKRIKKHNLEKDFILLGAVANPYPYYSQTDIYVHATRFEGKSIAIQEAQALGCAIVASDCSGNREQVNDGEDGILCRFDAVSIRDAVLRLITDEEKRNLLGRAASGKKLLYDEDLQMIFELLEDD